MDQRQGPLGLAAGVMHLVPAPDEQMGEFLALLRVHMADYVERTMEQMNLSWSEFEQLVQKVGQVFAIHVGDDSAGYLWIEERNRTLHIHGLILREPLQNRGIGSRALLELENSHSPQVNAIELGVHYSNLRARALYERLGFQVVRDLEDLGFWVMQKPLHR
jgi:ribosomal protein S18 acetylase RimI-like enzyme